MENYPYSIPLTLSNLEHCPSANHLMCYALRAILLKQDFLGMLNSVGPHSH